MHKEVSAFYDCLKRMGGTVNGRSQMNLIFEEYEELKSAYVEWRNTPNYSVKLGSGALVHEALDLAWVSLGLAYAFAGDKLDDCVAELVRANMSKLENPVFNENGKLSKPDGFKPARIVEIIEGSR